MSQCRQYSGQEWNAVSEDDEGWSLEIELLHDAGPDADMTDEAQGSSPVGTQGVRHWEAPVDHWRWFDQRSSQLIRSGSKRWTGDWMGELGQH